MIFAGVVMLVVYLAIYLFTGVSGPERSAAADRLRARLRGAG